jgi:hypothetical protein
MVLEGNCFHSLKIRRCLAPWGFNSPSRHHIPKQLSESRRIIRCTFQGATVRIVETAIFPPLNVYDDDWISGSLYRSGTAHSQIHLGRINWAMISAIPKYRRLPMSQAGVKTTA